MPFLAAFAAQMMQWFLTKVVPAIWNFLSNAVARFKRNKEIDDSAKKVTEEIKHAESDEERKKAVDDLNRSGF